MIHNIVFDYGGVIIDLDFTRPKQEFEKLGIANLEDHYAQLHKAGVFDLLEKGKISEFDFRDAFRHQVDLPLTDGQIDQAWNSMIVGIRPEKINFLTGLIAPYKTFLLSNTNFIHLKAITKHLLRLHGRVNLDSLFDNVYYSCVLGMRKPDEEIYHKVIEDNSLKRSDTLYIDDSLEHVEGARRAGLIAAHYDSSEPLQVFFPRVIQQLNQTA